MSRSIREASKRRKPPELDVNDKYLEFGTEQVGSGGLLVGRRGEQIFADDVLREHNGRRDVRVTLSTTIRSSALVQLLGGWGGPAAGSLVFIPGLHGRSSLIP